MRPPLRQLLAGSAARRRWWHVGLAAAAFIATTVGALMVSVGPAYDGRLARDAARSPTFLGEGGDPEAAVALWHWRTEDIDMHYVDVMTLGVLDRSAPPPPGVPRWPGPGEIYASDAVVHTGSHEPFLARYGTLVGTIDPAALADPGERIVYVGASSADMDPDRAYAITGFGAPINSEDTGYFGAALYQQGRQGFIVGLLLFGLSPALVLSTVVMNLDAEHRHQRLTVLRLLGASPGRVRRSVLAEVWPATAAGVGVALLAAESATIGQWPLPFLRFTVVGADLAPARQLFLAVALAVTAWFCGLALVTFRDRGAGRSALLGVRPVPRPRPASRWPLLVLVAVVVATNFAFTTVYASDPGLAAIVAVGGAAVAVLVMGAATATLVRGAADATATAARQAGRARPVALVVGRDLSALSRPAVRATAGLAVAAVLAVQVAVWTSYASGPVQEARAGLRANAQLSLELSSVPRRGLPELLGALPGHPRVLGISSDDAGEPTLLGSCEALTAVTGSCHASTVSRPTMRQLLLWVPEGTAITVVPDSEALARASGLLLFSSDGAPLDRDGIAAAVNEVESTPIGVAWPGQGYAISGVNYEDQGRWFSAGGVLGVLTIVVMASFSLAFETLRLTRRFSALGSMVGHPATYTRLAAGMIGIPLGASMLAGLMVATFLVLAPTAPGMPGRLPGGVLLALLLGAIVVIAVQVGLVSRALRGGAARWRPGNEA